MFAPRRVPPCLIASVATSNTCISEHGPRGGPAGGGDEVAGGPQAGEREPRCHRPSSSISAAQRTASNTPVVESSTGTTKHAASWPSGRPAFMRVGEFGDELERGHRALEGGRGGGNFVGRPAELRLGGGDVPRHAAKQLFRRLDESDRLPARDSGRAAPGARCPSASPRGHRTLAGEGTQPAGRGVPAHVPRRARPRRGHGGARQRLAGRPRSAAGCGVDRRRSAARRLVSPIRPAALRRTTPRSTAPTRSRHRRAVPRMPPIRRRCARRCAARRRSRASSRPRTGRPDSTPIRRRAGAGARGSRHSSHGSACATARTRAGTTSAIRRSATSRVIAVTATWQLDRLVYDRDELRITAIATARRRDRRRLGMLVVHAYYDWLRARAAARDDPRLAVAADEAAAVLDAMTDGWFTSTSHLAR